MLYCIISRRGQRERALSDGCLTVNIMRIFPVFLSVFSLSWMAQAEPLTSVQPHQHGVASLNVVLDGYALELELESPLANLLGFEHAPRTASEQQAYQQLQSRLQDAAALYLPAPEAGCTPGRIEAHQMHHTEDLEADGAHRHEHDSEHGDIRVRYIYQCRYPAAFNRLELPLLTTFPGIQRLHLQLITARGQHGWTVTPEQPYVAF